MGDVIRAVVQTGPRQLEMREFPRPVIGPDDGGLLRVEACGICGSDVEQYRGNLSSQWLPMVPGHEPLGIIEEVSDSAAARWGVRPGDRVAVEILIPCRSCDLCLAGRYMSCRHRIGSHGGSNPPERGLGPWGGFSEYIHLHPNAILHKVRGDIPAEVAVMFNPLGAGVRWAVHLGGVGLGDTVLILGAGQRGPRRRAGRPDRGGRDDHRDRAWRAMRASWRWRGSSARITRSTSRPRTPWRGSSISPAGPAPTWCSS